MNNRSKVRRRLNYILKSRVHHKVWLTYDGEHQAQEPPCRIYRTTDERIRLLWYLCKAGFYPTSQNMHGERRKEQQAH